MAKKIINRNYCVPQERLDYGDSQYKWVLDSDCGRKLAGTARLSPSSLSYVAELTVASSISAALTSSDDFFYIKNTGKKPLLVSLDNATKFPIYLRTGESFSSQIATGVIVRAKCAIALQTTTIEYLSAT